MRSSVSIPSSRGQVVDGRAGEHRQSFTGRVVGTMLMLLLPLGLLIAGLCWQQRALLQPVKGGLVATGVVSGSHGGGLTGVSPVITFVDNNGRRRDFTAPSSSRLPAMGTPATVSYDPSDPAAAHDLSDAGAQWPLGVGVGLLIAGLGEWFCWRLVLGFRRGRSF